MYLLDSISFHLVGKTTHILGTRNQSVLKVAMVLDDKSSCNFRNFTFKSSVKFDRHFNLS